MLEVRDLHASYGPIAALRGVSLTVNEGETVTLIGPNGAGKSTLLRSIIGVHPSVRGRIEFGGRGIASWAAHRRVAMGISLVPEGRGILPAMSVRENLMMGAYPRRRARDSGGLIDELLVRFPVLADRQRQTAGTLSGGEQQMLAVARALLARPKLLMLDEPSLGLAPRMVAAVFEIIGTLRQEGLTTLLVEQNARLALRMADRAYVLESGVIATSGTAEQVAGDERVQEVYLGTRMDLESESDAATQG